MTVRFAVVGCVSGRRAEGRVQMLTMNAPPDRATGCIMISWRATGTVDDAYGEISLTLDQPQGGNMDSTGSWDWVMRKR